MSASEQLSLDIWSAEETLEALNASGDSGSQAGVALARKVLGVSSSQIESLSPKNPVKRFEQVAIDRLSHFLSNSFKNPLLSLDEVEAMVRDQDSYFSSIRRYVKPSSAEGDDLSIRQARAEASARRGRTKVYAEQLVGSLASVDNCRSWRWYLINGDFSPVKPEDSPEDTQRRLAVDLANLLAAARRRNLLVGGHNNWVIDSLIDRFDKKVSCCLAGDCQSEEEIKLAIDLTVLVGRNAVLKTNFWINLLSDISKGYRIFDPDIPKVLDEYNCLRPTTHRQNFDPLRDLLPRFAKNDQRLDD